MRNKITQTKPTMLLRWVDGVLHQGWETIEYTEGGGPIDRTFEYRPVPSETTSTEGRS